MCCCFEALCVVCSDIERFQKDAMETNRKEFTYWLLIDIMGYLDISPIRVSKLEVREHNPILLG